MNPSIRRNTKMIRSKAPRKDKYIKVYAVVSEKQEGGDISNVRKYPYPPSLSGGLKAYILETKAEFAVTSDVTGAIDTITAYINYRTGITSGMFLDYGDRTYLVKYADPYDFLGHDLKITASSCPRKDYAREEYNGND